MTKVEAIERAAVPFGKAVFFCFMLGKSVQ